MNDKKISLSSYVECRNQLLSMMRHLNKDQEYAIYAHQINDVDDSHYAGGDIIEKKINGIANNGLDCYPYASIGGTLNFLGFSSDLRVVDKIFDYRYTHYAEPAFLANYIAAFPKNIEFNGNMVEFATYNGTDTNSVYLEGDPLHELKEAYREATGLFSVDRQNFKFCPLDVIKDDMHPLPIEYSLGVLTCVDGEYSFFDPQTHMSYLPKDEQDAFMQQQIGKLNNAAENYGTQDLLKVITTDYREFDKYDTSYLEF